MRKQIAGRKRAPKQRESAPASLTRDLDGFVHTPSGFISQMGYELVRREHPHLALPAHADLPLLHREGE